MVMRPEAPLIFIFLMVFPFKTWATVLNSEHISNVSCIGPQDAKKFVVYIHGVDSVIPSTQEQNNRDILSKVAFKNNVRFALPRSPIVCPFQKWSICWAGNFKTANQFPLLETIVESRKKCFSADKKYSLLGFSNGGYLLASWYFTGRNPSLGDKVEQVISFGSENYLGEDRLIKYDKKPIFILASGTKDKYNSDPKHTLYSKLKNKGAPVNLISFEGGHLLNEGALSEALQFAKEK